MKKSTRQIRLVVLFAAWAMQRSTGEAAVAWSGTAAELRVAAGQEKTAAEFAFRNSGARPVRFTSLRP